MNHQILQTQDILSQGSGSDDMRSPYKVLSEDGDEINYVENVYIKVGNPSPPSALDQFDVNDQMSRAQPSLTFKPHTLKPNSRAQLVLSKNAVNFVNQDQRYYQQGVYSEALSAQAKAAGSSCRMASEQLHTEHHEELQFENSSNTKVLSTTSHFENSKENEASASGTVKDQSRELRGQSDTKYSEAVYIDVSSPNPRR